MKKHDIVRKGFNVEPNLLAHDLALLKLSKDPNLSFASDEMEYYDAYCNLLDEFEKLIDDKLRYDGNLK